MDEAQGLLLRARAILDLAEPRSEVAEVVIAQSRDLSVRVRKGEVERVEEAGAHGAGLRVFVDGRAGSASSNDLTDAGLERLVDDALDVAKMTEPDPFDGPPEPELLATDIPDLELEDPELARFDATAATEAALACEQAALESDARLTNSDGAECARTHGAMAFATTGGFAGAYPSSFVRISARPLADDGGGKKRGASHWDAQRFLEALADPSEVGRRAAEKTLARLGAEKVPTAEMPVIFDPDAGRALLGALAGCTSGGAVHRRSTYLADREGSPVASSLVTIVDDPLILRGPGSRPFDGEGLPSRRNVVVNEGLLETFLCDCYAGRKLSRPSTGSASRGLGGRPGVSTSNFRMLPGDASQAELIADTQRGLLVTSMMGFGFNAVTGDFSRGAEGFLIEDGRIGRPVSEVTISLNFDELWRSIDAVGHDVDERSSTAVPSFRVAKMTVAGR
ncbi:MAG: metallopeptidase TldD-related protein [Myxococcota bacterium]